MGSIRCFRTAVSGLTVHSYLLLPMSTPSLMQLEMLGHTVDSHFTNLSILKHLYKCMEPHDIE